MDRSSKHHKDEAITKPSPTLIVRGTLTITAGGFAWKIPLEITARHVMRYFALCFKGSCYKRQKPQAPTPQAPIRNRQTRNVANAKGLNRNTNLT